MPLSIIAVLAPYIETNVGLTVWDGEIPRRNTSDQVIDMDKGVPDWPVMKLSMTEAGMGRTGSTETAYSDVGPLFIELFSVNRDDLEDTVVNRAITKLGYVSKVEQLLCNARNHLNLTVVPPPYEIVDLFLENWTVMQVEGVRIRRNHLLYRAEMRYAVDIHGETPERED